VDRRSADADLVVALDDADGRILYARFFPQEGTASTFAALQAVLRNYGRFCELYTDRGSHFCQSGPAGEVAEEQHGQVSQALRVLGIHQILARSPQARGRSERAFGTIQGRLPQELRHHVITDYAAANRYLEQHFIADFNRRFTVKPAQPESAFIQLAGIELELVLSSKHERIVRNDNTVHFQKRDSAAARNPPPHPLRPLPGNGPSIRPWHSGHQLSGPSTRTLRCLRRTTPAHRQ
jgi:hypothetical protein